MNPNPGSIPQWVHPQKDLDQRYIELELLGSGGMGEVYRGTDQECHRPVAIKKIRREFQNDQEARARFHAEAELTASLEHPGVIPIYGKGTDQQGRDYYVMRLISGEEAGTFAQSIRQFHDRRFANTLEESWNLRDLVRRLVDIADTIAYAHSQSIVHRDLKPSNILIGPYGETLIADWGLARRLPPSESHIDLQMTDRPTVRSEREKSAWLSVGTPGYRAPDASSGTTDQALRSADIYSIGAMLICILTNHPPGGESSNALALTDVPGIKSLKAIASRATAPNWKDRYTSAEEFRSDLLNWIAGEPVSARSEGWWEQAIRWPSRHRTAATGLASACVITLLGGILFSVYQSEQNRIISTQAGNLQRSLDESARLLKETQKANETAEKRRIEADKNRELAEKRESLAYDGLVKFQDLLSTNQEIFRSPQLARLNDVLSQESKEIYEAILNDFKSDPDPNPEAVARLIFFTRRLAIMDADLGKPQQAYALIEQASGVFQDRLDALRPDEAEGDTKAYADSLRLRIAHLRTLRAALALRKGQVEDSRPFFQSAIDQIEPLIQGDSLDADDRHMAILALMEAWSGIAMHESNFGDLNQAKKYQQKAIDLAPSDPPSSMEDANAKIQVYGNMAILQERAGDRDPALKNLELALQFVADAFGRLHQNPGGIGEKGATVMPPLELVGKRFNLSHAKTRLLLAKQDVESATKILSDLAQKEAELVRLLPVNSNLVEFYLRTAANLGSLLINNGQQSEATKLFKEWIDLAKTAVGLPSASEPQWMLLIQAHHSAGHLHQKLQQVDSASEEYGQALQRCHEAMLRGFSTPRVLSQKIELLIHQMQLQSPSKPIEQVESIFQSAVETTEQLMRSAQAPVSDKSTAVSQLQKGIELMRQTGNEQFADRWQEVLKSKGLKP